MELILLRCGFKVYLAKSFEYCLDILNMLFLASFYKDKDIVDVCYNSKVQKFP